MPKDGSREIGKDEKIDDLLTEEVLSNILRNSNFTWVGHKAIKGILIKVSEGKRLTREERDYIEGVRVKKRIATLAIREGELSEKLLKKYRLRSKVTPTQKAALKKTRGKKTKREKEEAAIQAIEEQGAKDQITRRRVAIFYMLQRYPVPSQQEMADELGVHKNTVQKDLPYVPKLYGDIAEKTTSEEHVQKELARMEADLAEWREIRRTATFLRDKVSAQSQINRIIHEIIALKKENGLIITVEQRVAIRTETGEEEEFSNEFWDKMAKEHEG